MYHFQDKISSLDFLTSASKALISIYFLKNVFEFF